MDYAIALPNTYQTLTGLTTRAGMVAAFVAVLQSVGWTATPISGGYRCLGASPQGYVVYADIWDNGGNVSIRLSSTTSAAVGYEHYISVGGAWTWTIAAHPCGFAISRTDAGSDPIGSCVLAGIPRVPSGCGLAAANPITEIWFSFGDGTGSPSYAADCPRHSLDIGNELVTGNQTGCINGTLWGGGDSGNHWSQPQIVRQSSAAGDTGSADSHPLWYDGTDFVYPALIAWGDDAGGPVKVRGQVYNAAVRSSSTARDVPKSWDTIDWMNYTDAYYWGSLWVMASNGGGSEICNVAY